MKKNKLYSYFWIVSLIFITLSLFWRTIEDAFIDINIHDTYFIIHISHFYVLLTIIYAILGLFYLICSFKNIVLNNFTTKIHSAVSFCILPVYAIGNYTLNKKSNANFPLFDDYVSLNWFLFTIVFIFVITQILFIVNVIYVGFRQLFLKK